MAEDRRLFGMTADWSTVVLNPGVWYRTIRKGCCRFMVACVKEEEKASEHRQRKREGEKRTRLRLHLG